ncbi:MAG: hypothetical protein IT561_24245 [Alphaproteobacteria bacterium]|nr:hypothetical protein [Alphaproteobacteria bacterium]
MLTLALLHLGHALATVDPRAVVAFNEAWRRAVEALDDDSRAQAGATIDHLAPAWSALAAEAQLRLAREDGAAGPA